MRCARCDRITAREVVARDRDGRLVFGWCPSCLDEEGCTISDGPAAPLRVSARPGFRRRIRLLRRALIRSASSRRLAGLGIAGLLAAWALILCYIGGVKLARPGDKGGSFLLGGAGIVAMMSLGFWLGLISRNRPRSRDMGLKVVRVASGVIAAGALAIAVRGHGTVRDVGLFGAALVVFIASWAGETSRKRKLHHGDTESTEKRRGGIRR